MVALRKPDGEFTQAIPSGNGVTFLYVKKEDEVRAQKYLLEGFNHLLRTPDKTVIFETKEQAQQIKTDQAGCMGCLSACRFSGWSDNEAGTTSLLPDPRSFCIEKSLQDIGHGGSIDDNLLFSGHHAYRFASDPLYSNGNIPTIKDLVDVIKVGD
jgi:hypothetical protein